MTERDDPILDACLDEVLGGRTPPDLTARILQAMAAQGVAAQGMAAQAGASQAADDRSIPVVPPPAFAHDFAAPEPPPVVASNGRPLVEVRTPASASRRTRNAPWQPMLVAASVITIGLAVGVATLVFSNRTQIADNQPPQPQAPEVAQQQDERESGSGSREPEDSIPHPPSQIPNLAERPLGPNNPARQPIEGVAPPSPPSAIAAAPPLPPRRYLEPSPDAEIVSFVNAELSRVWTEVSVNPAPPATDAEWCRRLFVRVLGRIPTVEELETFKNDRSRDKRQRLVDRLLSDEQYVAEYARHWAGVWSNVLIGRTGGLGDSPASREGLEQYLADALARNTPYDELVHELLTATGAAEPGAPDHNGAVNFLLDGLGKDATVATSRVARVLLGTQLQCAQCHTHPTQELSQEQFWALNAFFRQTHVERRGGITRLANAGQGRGAGGEVFYETPAGLLKTAQPRFLDGTEIIGNGIIGTGISGEAAAVDRRAELARLVVRSDQLPRATVNRLWSHFFGYGFTRPVDDLGPNASPSHPQLLDRLAREFEAHEYDLKSVIRWIALSDAFARSSRMADVASRDMPEAGEMALFSRYYARPMQAEEVYNSLVQAAQIRRTAASEAEVANARRAWLGQFQRNMATDDAQEESHFGGVRQSLIMMNGDLTRQAVNTQHAGLLKTLATSEMTFPKKVEHLFLSALSREPKRRELRAADTILANSRGVEATALEDILWALLNSNEFILDH